MAAGVVDGACTKWVERNEIAVGRQGQWHVPPFDTVRKRCAAAARNALRCQDKNRL
jgi:hypothetical protein